MIQDSNVCLKPDCKNGDFFSVLSQNIVQINEISLKCVVGQRDKETTKIFEIIIATIWNNGYEKVTLSVSAVLLQNNAFPGMRKMVLMVLAALTLLCFKFI